MSDEGEVWKSIKADSKIRREEKQESAKAVLVDWARMREIEYKEITPYQIRLSNDEFSIDIYPQRNKYHDLRLNKRGQYGDLIKFLTQHFLTD